MKHANENKPSRAWLEFYANKYEYKKLSALNPRLCAALKNGSSGLWGDKRESSDYNFIWFMRFELSCRETEIKLRRDSIKAVS